MYMILIPVYVLINCKIIHIFTGNYGGHIV